MGLLYHGAFVPWGFRTWGFCTRGFCPMGLLYLGAFVWTPARVQSFSYNFSKLKQSVLKTYLGKPVFTNLESHKETLENEIFFLTKAITGKYIQVRCHYTRAEGILTT